jgi:hypothetical protein
MGLKEFLTIKIVYFHLYPQYSSIPFWCHKQVAINKTVFSISCRIFETPNYVAEI